MSCICIVLIPRRRAATMQPAATSWAACTHTRMCAGFQVSDVSQGGQRACTLHSRPLHHKGTWRVHSGVCMSHSRHGAHTTQPAAAPLAARGRTRNCASVANCAPLDTSMRGLLLTESSPPPSLHSSRCVSFTCSASVPARTPQTLLISSATSSACWVLCAGYSQR